MAIPLLDSGPFRTVCSSTRQPKEGIGRSIQSRFVAYHPLWIQSPFKSCGQLFTPAITTTRPSPGSGKRIVVGFRPADEPSRIGTSTSARVRAEGVGGTVHGPSSITVAVCLLHGEAEEVGVRGSGGVDGGSLVLASSPRISSTCTQDTYPVRPEIDGNCK
jgi:hypothetical protein